MDGSMLRMWSNRLSSPSSSCPAAPGPPSPSLGEPPAPAARRSVVRASRRSSEWSPAGRGGLCGGGRGCGTGCGTGWYGAGADWGVEAI